MPFSTEAGEHLIFSEHQIKSGKAKSGCTELVVADRFIPLWSLPVTQKHSPPNHARAPQKWSFAGDSHLIEKRSGLLGFCRLWSGGVSHPGSAMLQAAAPSVPRDRLGSSAALPPERWFAGAVTALAPAPCLGGPGGICLLSLLSPAPRAEPFRGLGLVWKESESMILPSWCVSISFLMPFRSCQMGCSSLDPSFMSACSFSHLFVSRPEVFSPKQVHL